MVSVIAWSSLAALWLAITGLNVFNLRAEGCNSSARRGWTSAAFASAAVAFLNFTNAMEAL